MCFNMCACCRHTRGRFECTHGGVLNLQTVDFPACQPTSHVTRHTTTRQHDTTTRQHDKHTAKHNTTQYTLSRHTHGQHSTTQLTSHRTHTRPTPDPHVAHAHQTHTPAQQTLPPFHTQCCCLVYSVIERGLSPLNSVEVGFLSDRFSEGKCVSNASKLETTTGL